MFFFMFFDFKAKVLLYYYSHNIHYLPLYMLVWRVSGGVSRSHAGYGNLHLKEIHLKKNVLHMPDEIWRIRATIATRFHPSLSHTDVLSCAFRILSRRTMYPLAAASAAYAQRLAPPNASYPMSSICHKFTICCSLAFWRERLECLCWCKCSYNNLL